mmetsp:Transcript_15672/g.42454  ORF Transcript_15672/g.42454 Transcript_15672/m.42454 type:complete len:220 (+) Transcript_15672:207-866(+)
MAQRPSQSHLQTTRLHAQTPDIAPNAHARPSIGHRPLIPASVATTGVTPSPTQRGVWCVVGWYHVGYLSQSMAVLPTSPVASPVPHDTPRPPPVSLRRGSRAHEPRGQSTGRVATACRRRQAHRHRAAANTAGTASVSASLPCCPPLPAHQSATHAPHRYPRTTSTCTLPSLTAHATSPLPSVHLAHITSASRCTSSSCRGRSAPPAAPPATSTAQRRA